jgi:threonine synthase
MRLYSTNHSSPEVNFKEAVLQGQASDKGLYFPESIPKLEQDELHMLINLTYPQLATKISEKFLYKEVPPAKIRQICETAYNYKVPLEKVDEKNFILRLDQGPTAAFKDFAARFMAGLMSYFLEESGRKINILVATSGDTGSAIANAFWKNPNVNVFILYPLDEVSDRQRRLMTVLDHNVFCYAVEGKFDDCQKFVKTAFADSDLTRYNFTSANSINIGRLIPQSFYYFWAYFDLLRHGLISQGEEIVFSVPSGNFGNVMGGLIAQAMGLPVQKFVAATNLNDSFPKFLQTGKYSPVSPSKNCLSNAMNVGHPNNLARIIDWLGKGRVTEKGEIQKNPDLQSIKDLIYSSAFTDEETVVTMQEFYAKHQTVIEQHGAVGWLGLQKYFRENPSENTISILLETAHPAKFPKEVKGILEVEPELPESMKGLENQKEYFETIPADYDKFKKTLIDKISNL